ARASAPSAASSTQRPASRSTSAKIRLSAGSSSTTSTRPWLPGRPSTRSPGGARWKERQPHRKRQANACLLVHAAMIAPPQRDARMRIGHNHRYLSPVPVLNSTTFSPGPKNDPPRNRRKAAHAAPPPGHTSTPLRRARSAAAGAISSSGTATAVPLVSRRARRQRKPAMGDGTRNPYALVRAFGHGSVTAAPASNAATTGAHP